jgi:hypothetical protein
MGLWPREHGAIVELLLPQAAALIVGGPNIAAIAFAVAAVAVFAAHEPYLILAGRRGTRAKKDLGTAARRRLALLLLIGLAAAILAFATSSPSAQLGALAPAVAALAALPVVVYGKEKTTMGELMVGSTLALAAVPTVLAGGATHATAFTMAAAWAVTFALSTLAVRAILAKPRDGARYRWRRPIAAAASVLVATASIATLVATAVPQPLSASMLVVAVVTLTLALVKPHPRHLRRLGWFFLVVDLGVLAALVAALSS